MRARQSKRHFIFVRSFFGLLALLGGAGADASAWSRPKHEFLVISRTDYFISHLSEVSVRGERVRGRFERVESNTYVEFGLTDNLTVGGKAFYGSSWLSRGDDVEVASGFNEIEGFVQYQIFRTGRRAGAVKIAVGVPAAFRSRARPAFESEGVDVELSILYARDFTFRPLRIYVAGEVGYRRRFSASADQVRLVTTIGVEPGDKWLVLLDTFSVKSLGNKRANGADYDVVKFQPSIVWRATGRLAVQAGVSEEVAGRNIDLGRTYFIGVWTRF